MPLSCESADAKYNCEESFLDMASPKKKTKRRVALSLFSGAGGMDIGVMAAGFDVVACVEVDPHCCETLRAAAAREGRSTRVIEDDIREIDPKALMSQLKLKPGELDLLCGGPPCGVLPDWQARGFGR